MEKKFFKEEGFLGIMGDLEFLEKVVGQFQGSPKLGNQPNILFQ